jgi:hypothetical protein
MTHSGTSDLSKLRLAMTVIPNGDDFRLPAGANGEQLTPKQTQQVIIMEIHSQTGGSPEGLEIARDWYEKEDRSDELLADTWLTCDEAQEEPPTRVNLFALADAIYPGWHQEPVDLWGKFDPPELPKGLLPEVIEKFAIEQGDVMGADPSGFAVAALAVCAAAISDRNNKVRVKRNDSWIESARLWVALIGDPSRKKTPIIYRTTRPINSIDSHMWREYLAARDRFESLTREEQRNAERPAQRRLRIEDTTIEAAQEVLRSSPDGVLCVQDELSAWFAAMDKYSGHRGAAKDRGFWLQAYNGGTYGFHRVTRGSGLIENLSISLIGGIQPDPMRKLAADTVDDGLIQRLIPIVLGPAKVGRDDEDISQDAGRQYDELIRTLHTLPTPIDDYQFNDDARKIRKSLERKHLYLTSCEAINRKLASHIGKYDGLFARLCLIWQCIENPQSGFISEETAQRVSDFMHKFLLPHAISFYMGILGLSDDHDRLSKVAGYILARKLDRVTSRDVQRGDRTMRRLERNDVESVFHQLEALGWVTRRPGARFTDPPHMIVHPVVHSRFADRARAEKNRRERDRRMIAEMLSGERSVAIVP